MLIASQLWKYWRSLKVQLWNYCTTLKLYSALKVLFNCDCFSKLLCTTEIPFWSKLNCLYLQSHELHTAKTFCNIGHLSTYLQAFQCIDVHTTLVGNNLVDSIVNNCNLLHRKGAQLLRVRITRTSVTSKKSPNVYKSCTKMISLEDGKISTPLPKLPNYEVNLGNIIVAIGFKKLPKLQ